MLDAGRTSDDRVPGLHWIGALFPAWRCRVHCRGEHGIGTTIAPGGLCPCIKHGIRKTIAPGGLCRSSRRWVCSCSLNARPCRPELAITEWTESGRPNMLHLWRTAPAARGPTNPWRRMGLVAGAAGPACLMPRRHCGGHHGRIPGLGDYLRGQDALGAKCPRRCLRRPPCKETRSSHLHRRCGTQRPPGRLAATTVAPTRGLKSARSLNPPCRCESLRIHAAAHGLSPASASP